MMADNVIKLTHRKCKRFQVNNFTRRRDFLRAKNGV